MRAAGSHAKHGAHAFDTARYRVGLLTSQRESGDRFRPSAKNGLHEGEGAVNVTEDCLCQGRSICLSRSMSGHDEGDS